MSTKIFGLAELPVETIGDVVKINSNSKVPEPVLYESANPQLSEEVKQGFSSKNLATDMYQGAKKPNAFVRMRNGIGKLMHYFSKVKPKAIIK